MAQENETTVADLLNTLTYNMCWSYGRATVAINIPPPVYYADLACERGRRYLARLFFGDSATDTHENKVKGKNAEQTKAEGKRPESRDAEQKDIAVHPDL